MRLLLDTHSLLWWVFDDKALSRKAEMAISDNQNEVFVSAAKTTAVIMFLVAAAMVSAWLITVAQLPAELIRLLQPFMGNQTLLLIAIMVLVMAVGTAMDMAPTILWAMGLPVESTR